MKETTVTCKETGYQITLSSALDILRDWRMDAPADPEAAEWYWGEESRREWAANPPAGWTDEDAYVSWRVGSPAEPTPSPEPTPTPEPTRHILSVNLSPAQLKAVRDYAEAQGYDSPGKWLKAWLTQEVPGFPPSASWGGKREKKL